MKNQTTRELKRKEYIFNFEGGGWNSVYAKTLKGAIKEIREEYKDSPTLKPDYSTVRIKTEEEYKYLLSLFY